MPALRGVIVDVDGTLIDSNDQHARAWVDAFAEGGLVLSYATVRPLIGMGADNLLPRLTGRPSDSALGQRLSAAHGRIFKARYWASVRPFPAARDLLAAMRAHGLELAVASSAQGDELQALLDCAGVAALIASRTSASDAAESKPDPDIVHAALGKLGMDAGDVLMLGDTPYDIAAAGKLGIRAIGVRCGGWEAPDLVGALAVYADPADLLAHYDDSPLAQGIPAGALPGR